MNEFNLDYCPYKTLEVDFGADSGVIKSQFRKLVLIYHPDKSNSDDLQNSKNDILVRQIIESYNILICPIKRKKYDYDNNINNTRKKYKSLSEAIEDVLENAPPDVFNRIGTIYNNIRSSNELKLCKTLYNSLPEELQFKLKFMKNTEIYDDLNQGLNYILKKYNDINYESDFDTNEPEIKTSNHPTVNPSSSQIVLFENNTQYKDVSGFDYDITNNIDPLINININIDIKDQYNNNIKYIFLKKHDDIIKIPIFCSKKTYLVDKHLLKPINQQIQININIRNNNLYISNYDIIYKKNVSLYEYYFKCTYQIPLPNDLFISVSDNIIFRNKCKILHNKGLPINDFKRGNIIIFYNLILPDNIDLIYKSIIEVIFPPINKSELYV